MSDHLQFLRALTSRQLTHRDRAVALLWWHGTHNGGSGATPNQLASELEQAGYGQQNSSRLRDQLEADRRTAKNRDGTLRVALHARAALDAELVPLVNKPQPAPETDSVLPLDLFRSRGYIRKVVHQINASYDAWLYDCTAVMARRLLETLIIEVYDKAGRANELKKDGNFMMFAGLLAHLEADDTMHLGRESMRGLREFKSLGDQSAHNRRFNARKDDIDRVRNGLRLAAEELLHLAGLDP